MRKVQAMAMALDLEVATLEVRRVKAIAPAFEALKREAESVTERIAVETAEFNRLLQPPEAKAFMQALVDRRKPS
jgi:hypothetical protein